MIPPLLIYVRVGRAPLPLPVFLLWPLLLVLFFFAAVVLPLLPVRGTTIGGRALLPFRLWRALCATRGLRVGVQAADGRRLAIACW